MVDPLDERDENLDVPDDPSEVDDETFSEWVSEHGEAVKDVLEEMTAVYADDGEKRPIKNASVSHVAPDKEYVGVQFDLPDEVDPDVAGANILRLLDDLNAHEMSHKNWSDLRAKKNIAECYPGFGRLAGHIQNMVEDEYIDARRKVRWKGMKEKLAYYVWLHMNTESRAPPADEVYEKEGMEDAMMNAMLQTALAGYVNGIEDAPDEIAECMARVEPLFDKVRSIAVRDEENDIPGRESADERATLTHAILNILIRYLPDPSEVDEDKMDERSRDTSAQPDPEMSPPSPDDEPQMELPDEIADAVKDVLEEMANDDAMPDPAPDVETGGDGPEIEVEMESDEMGDALEDTDDESPSEDMSEPGEAPETEESEPGEGDDPVEGGSDPADPGGSTDETDMDDADPEAGGEGTGEDEITRDLEALVEEHGAENLVVDG